MIKVLFVCLGNICRSPMGEFMMKDKVLREEISEAFYISSAGTSGEEEGNPVYPPAREELAKQGISCSGKRARKFTKADYKEYDYILAMESRNVTDLLRIAGGDPDGKIFRLLDFTSFPRDIADPWYTRNFTKTREDLEEGLEGFLSYLKREKKIK